jgi:alpha-mannosidase
LKIKQILMIPHTHHDMGYTHIPEVVMRSHVDAIYEVLRLCERVGADHEDEAFRWTIEISEPLMRFLKSASPDEVYRLQSLIARRRLSITGGYMHMTQLIGHEEYVRFFYPVREFRQRYGLPVSVVQHGDINGMSWGVVPLMRQIGLDCLVLPLNPDHGRAPFEQPSAFVWEGQDGSRILVWLSMFYSLANNPWALTAGRIDKAQEPLAALVKRLNERDDYPFDFALIHSAEDNMLPNALICEAVRAWNAAGLQPPMRIATMDEAMERARAQAVGANLPVVRGEWADWWAHGHGSSAYETGISRLARSELRAAEVGRALAVLSGQPFQRRILTGDVPITNWYRSGNAPPLHEDWTARVDGVYADLLLFEEHTWGSFESVSLPFSLFQQTHWNHKAHFAFRALMEAHDLSREALVNAAATLPEAPERNLIVINPLSVRRDDVVLVRTPGVDHTVFVSDLPPLGLKVIPWTPEAFDRVTDLPFPDDGMIENEFYRLHLDARRGAITSLIDKGTGKEWVDGDGLGSVVYEQPDPDDDHPSVRVHRSHFHPTSPGPRWLRTLAEGDGRVTMQRTAYGLILKTQTAAPFLPRIETTFTLYDRLKCIDVDVTLYKHESYEMEGVYVQFPFALDQPTFWLETANAHYRADLDQLPNSCRDWYSIQHGIGITDGTHSILWAAREAPLVQLGGYHTGKWSERLEAERGHLNSWLMNNLYFTNFKPAQGGHSRFQYRFTTQAGGLDGSEVRPFGEAFGVPPMGRLAPVETGAYQWLEIAPGNVQAQLLTPSRQHPRAAVLRLKETAGRATEATIRWLGEAPATLYKVDLLETQPGVPLAHGHELFMLPLAAHELATVLVVV